MSSALRVRIWADGQEVEDQEVDVELSDPALAAVACYQRIQQLMHDGADLVRLRVTDPDHEIDDIDITLRSAAMR